MRNNEKNKPNPVDDLRKRLRKCVTETDREKIIKKLVADSLSRSFKVRHESRTLLLAYLYGAPPQRQHVSGVGLLQVTHK